MDFIAINIKCAPAMNDILIAELGDIDFDTFEEKNDGLDAYVEEGHYDEERLLSILDKYQEKIAWETKRIKRENWNESWEKNYDPIVLQDHILIKAPFHKVIEKYPIEITILPKMSFGTGHHQTTSLMLTEQLTINHSGKLVYDFGTGTGILAIMARKMGAAKVIACDVDDWCLENSRENFSLNKFEEIDVHKGSVQELGLTEQAGLILANINLNVLLEELPFYYILLLAGGHLMLSGFYEQDIPDLTTKAQSLGLIQCSYKVDNGWAVIVFEKPTL